MTPILFSVSYSGSWGQARLSVEQFVDKAAGLGFGGVMLGGKRPHLSPLDWSGPARAALRSHLEAAGLRENVVAGYNNFTADLEHGEVPMGEIQIAYVTELCRLAHDVGAGVVRVFTGYEHPAKGYLAQWNLLVDCLRECARRAAELGVTLAVQNHHDLAVDYRSHRDLLEAVGEPSCRAGFDAWSQALQGVDLREAARAMAPLTAHTTVADYQRRPRFLYEPEVINYRAGTPYSQAVPMGEGFIDYRGFFAGLREGGFDGTVAYEMCSPLLGGGSEENLDRYARRFLEYFREL
ncbi:MAG: TIM barrel protein [Acidobacteria bacterium]|nr:TIM barrel protein [Acidobacteriota bacterium]